MVSPTDDDDATGNFEGFTNDVVYTNDVADDAAPTDVVAPGQLTGRRPCRYASDCQKLGDDVHCERFSHPGDEDLDVSQEGDQHAGKRYPRRQCRNHPGCIRRWSCFFSHGIIQSSAEGPRTCFFGETPHNGGCHNPTWNGQPFEFCSSECRVKASNTPKSYMGCRRYDCPCPCSMSGVAGQFCCDTCLQGTPCNNPVHTLPSTHLFVAPTPKPGKYAPCARSECACAVSEGSSWDGNAGEYCCRACRNGTGCDTLRHTSPEVVAEQVSASACEEEEPLCALEDCWEPTWNGQKGEYCCPDHRMMGMGNAVCENDEEDGMLLFEPLLSGDEEADVDAVGSDAAPAKPSFPDYQELGKRARAWIRSHTSGAGGGKVTNIWLNESLECETCPARVTFEKAVATAKLSSWRRGEFGWHGTKSVSNIENICWSNWSPRYRSGQVFGPGEYFSRGTGSGLRYSEGYAGGNAGRMLILAWITSYSLGAAPKDPSTNGACRYFGTGHIVCNNPVAGDEMYCLPVAVVAFGDRGTKPRFKLNEEGELATMTSGTISKKRFGTRVCSIQ